MDKTKDEIVEAGKTTFHENDELYGMKLPRPNCKHCHGTGKSAWDSTGKPVLCKCLYRTGKGSCITLSEFQMICQNTRDKYENKRSNN